MIKKIRETEQALMVLYNELEGLFPKLHCLTFTATQTKPKKLPRIHGFIHIETEGGCYRLNSMTDLIVMVKRKQVLYHNFDGLREVLK